MKQVTPETTGGDGDGDGATGKKVRSIVHMLLLLEAIQEEVSQEEK